MRADQVAADQQLRIELGQTLTDVEGVVRVEPTLRSALAAVTAGAVQSLIGRGSPGAAQALGIDLDQRTGVDAQIWTDVTADIATWPGRPAADVARAARTAVRDALTARGLTPGQVVVNVMDIEEESDPSTPAGTPDPGAGVV